MKANWLSIDLRSLALFRICLGIIILIDVSTRFLHFRAHYTSEGVLPLETYLIQPDLSFRLWSLFYVSDSPLLVGLLFCAFFLSALAFTLGYQTRWAGWLCWIFLVSIQHRNPLVLNAGDRYIVLLLFWGGFLPLGEALSIDSVRKAEAPTSWSSFSLAGFCYLLQVCFAYWFSAALRLGAEWQVEGSALYFTLHDEALRTSLATHVLGFGTAPLAFFSFASLRLEEFGPILLFLPFSRVRALAVFLIMSFHFGILLTLSIGVFSLVSMIAPLGLLPSMVWESRLGNWLFLRLDRGFVRLSRVSPKVTLPELSLLKLPSIRVVVFNVIPLVALGLTIFHLYWGIHWPDTKNSVSDVNRVLSLDQRWGVYSPTPPRITRVEGSQALTESGREVDLTTWEPYKYPLRRLVAREPMWNTRWTAYQSKFSLATKIHMDLYLNYLVRQWDEAHPDDRVVAAQILFHSKVTPRKYLLGEEGTHVVTVYHR